MKKWLPLDNILLDMIISNIPLPIISQKYRSKLILDNPSIEVIKCDKFRRMSFYVAELIPMKDNGKFIAFGRVFSGKIKKQKHYTIINEKYDNDKQCKIGKIVLF